MKLVEIQESGGADADNFRSIVLCPRHSVGDRDHPRGDELACEFQRREPEAAVRRAGLVFVGAIAAADLLKDQAVPPEDGPYRFRAARAHRRDLLPAGLSEKQFPRILTIPLPPARAFTELTTRLPNFAQLVCRFGTFGFNLKRSWFADVAGSGQPANGRRSG